MKNEQILLHNKPHFSPPRSLHGNVINETNHVIRQGRHTITEQFLRQLYHYTLFTAVFFHFFDNAATMMEDQ